MSYKAKLSNDEISVKLIDDDTPFGIREAFKGLRTNLMYTAENAESCPVYAVASVGESSGKSMVFSNLAVTFSKSSKKILLIDGDMRRPMQYKIFGEDKKTIGLSEVLSGIESDYDKVIVNSRFENLDLVLSGRIPPNPSELIMGDRFSTALERWRKQYDIIFIDFPPIGVVTDSLAVCRSVSGYIFVVRAGKNDIKEINDSLEQINKIGAKVIGVVLNDVKNFDKKKYGGKKYYTSYGENEKNN